jgi:hypothetical protein
MARAQDLRADAMSTFGSSHVSPYQALMWIGWRRPEYISKSKTISISSSLLQAIDDFIDGKEANHSAMTRTQITALVQLKAALEQGSVTASGRHNWTALPKALPAHYWPRLVFINERRAMPDGKYPKEETCVRFKNEPHGHIWSDLQFPADHILSIWPMQSAPIKKPTQNHHVPRLASDMIIHRAIKAVYDEKEKAGSKPPNLVEIIEPVKERVRDEGYEATGHRIQQLAEAPQHKKRRRKPGATLASEKPR